MITVENTKTEVLVTISKDAVPLRRLNVLLDWLRLEEVVQRSALSEADADRIADDLKSEWWAANKDRFIPVDER